MFREVAEQLGARQGEPTSKLPRGKETPCTLVSALSPRAVTTAPVVADT